MESKLYVGNLFYETNENELRTFFSQAGTVTEVILIKDRDTGRPKGFAFVTMSSKEEADAAVQRYNGQSLDSRELKVNIAIPREDRPRGNSSSGRPGGYNRY